MAKILGEVVKIENNVYEVPYLIYVYNYGDSVLRDVQVIDNLANTFINGAEVLEVSIESADAPLVINPSYTGNPGADSLLIASGSTLPSKQLKKIELTVIVDITNATDSIFYNTAIAYAILDSTVVFDHSINDVDPDPDGDGDPHNNDEPTPVSLFGEGSTDPAIGVALSLVDSVKNDETSYDFTFMAIVENLGPLDFKLCTAC